MEYVPALQYEQADEPAALHLSLAFGRESLPFGSQHSTWWWWWVGGGCDGGLKKVGGGGEGEGKT
jgi:hypothetical protein